MTKTRQFCDGDPFLANISYHTIFTAAPKLRTWVRRSPKNVPSPEEPFEDRVLARAHKSTHTHQKQKKNIGAGKRSGLPVHNEMWRCKTGQPSCSLIVYIFPTLRTFLYAFGSGTMAPKVASASEWREVNRLFFPEGAHSRRGKFEGRWRRCANGSPPPQSSVDPNKNSDAQRQ